MTKRTTGNTGKLINSEGRFQQGLHQQPVSEVNYRNFILRTPMGNRAGPLRRWFGFNQFQFISIISHDIIVGAAIAHTRLAVISFVYFYHTETKQLDSYRFKAPPFKAFCKTSLKPDNGQWFFRQGHNTIEMASSHGTRTLTVRLRDDTAIDMSFSDNNFEPMRCATRVDLNGFSYTQKVAGVPCRGQIHCPSGDFNLEERQACATMDWTAGYLKRRCFWNWICLSGVLPDGRYLGLNGACFTNESSFTENGFWLDGKLNKVSGMAFEYDPFNLYMPWRIYSNDGMVDLKFTPTGAQTEKNDFLIMASNFHQMIGLFSGELICAEGEIIEVNDFWGFTEEHYAKW